MPLIGDPRLRIYIFGSEPMNENGLDWMEGINGSMEIRGYLTGIMGFWFLGWRSSASSDVGVVRRLGWMARRCWMYAIVQENRSCCYLPCFVDCVYQLERESFTWWIDKDQVDNHKYNSARPTPFISYFTWRQAHRSFSILSSSPHLLSPLNSLSSTTPTRDSQSLCHSRLRNNSYHSL